MSGEVGQPHEAGEVGAAQLPALGHIEELLTVAVDQLGAAARCAIDICFLAIDLSIASLPRGSRCLHHRKPGTRASGAAALEEAVNEGSNACRRREVERKI